MAEDKSFQELIKEVQELNKSITKQNKGRADQLNDLVNAQNKTTEMVTRRLTKAQTAQLDKDNEQIRVAKEEADRQADADKKAQELEDKKFTMQKFNDRVANKLKKAPSALLGAARVATYNNKIMRGIAGTLKGLNRSFGIGSTIKAGGKTLFGIIKKLVQGGLIIGGIVLLDKFFNSDVWPKTIDFIEKKLIPGIKDFFKFMRDKFGPLVTRLLFGKGGTFAQPTGGLYGAIKSVGSWIARTSKDISDFMKEDDTGSKFKNMVKSFADFIGSLFGFGRGEGDVKTAKYGDYQKGYFQNIKDSAKKFKNDFVIFFESLARSFASGLFGYETDDEKFFKGIKNDMKKMFTQIVKGFGEAFAEQNPFIARQLGIKNAAQNRLAEFRESDISTKAGAERTARLASIERILNKGSSAELRQYLERQPEDRELVEEYLRLLSNQKASGIDEKGGAGKIKMMFKALGQKDTESGFRGLLEQDLINELIQGVKREGFLKTFDGQDADDIEKIGGKNAEKRKTQQAVEKFLEGKENQLMLLEKRNGSIVEIEALKNEIIKLKEVLETREVSGDVSILNQKGGDVFNTSNISNNRLVASADTVVQSYAKTG